MGFTSRREKGKRKYSSSEEEGISKKRQKKLLYGTTLAAIASRGSGSRGFFLLVLMTSFFVCLSWMRTVRSILYIRGRLWNGIQLIFTRTVPARSTQKG